MSQRGWARYLMGEFFVEGAAHAAAAHHLVADLDADFRRVDGDP